MKLAALFSGGKDSTYAVYLAQKEHDVKCLISVISENPNSYMFHTPNITLVGKLAECLGIPIITQATEGKKELEMKDLRKAVEKAIKDYKIEGIAVGAIASKYQFNNVKEMCADLKLKIFSPLWDVSQENYMEKLVKDFKVMIVGVAADGFSDKWLGRIIDNNALDELKALNRKYKISIAGEGGEYESLVLDGPNFRKRLEIVDSAVEMDSANSGVLRINKVKLVDKEKMSLKGMVN
jgi:ABC transporter with metal-binding/Fe-S-binding domain ATP-binding protein